VVTSASPWDLVAFHAKQEQGSYAARAVCPRTQVVKRAAAAVVGCGGSRVIGIRRYFDGGAGNGCFATRNSRRPWGFGPSKVAGRLKHSPIRAGLIVEAVSNCRSPFWWLVPRRRLGE
jgi:hypothetical protein